MRQRSRILKKIKRLRIFPFSAELVAGNRRQLVVGPWLIIYRVIDIQVQILAIRHSRQAVRRGSFE